MATAATPLATGVRVVPLGVGEAFSALHYTTCMALGAGDDWLLIDCPHPIRKMLHEGSLVAGCPLDLDRIQGVVLSHLHADHACGLEDFAYYSHFILGRKARVLAHPEVLARMWDGLLAAGMGEVQVDPATPAIVKQRDDYFEVTSLDETRSVTFGPFEVECRRTIHPIPTTAFRLSAHGRTLGFSADTVFDPSLIAWLEPCDLILHEVTTRPAAAVHTPYFALATLPSPLRAKMRVFHYPDDYDAAVSVIEPLRQGRIYPV
jgi:ribonuclease BN (tRNA processing enzyme)